MTSKVREFGKMANSSEIHDVQVGFLKVASPQDSSKSQQVESTTGKLSCIIKQSDALNASVSLEESISANTENIEERLLKWCDCLHLDVIFTVGGVGCGSEDVIPEAARLVLEKELCAMTVMLILVALQATPMVSLWRMVCGKRGSTLIVALPSHVAAAEACLKSILPIIPSAVNCFRENRDLQESSLPQQGSGCSSHSLAKTVLEEAKELREEMPGVTADLNFRHHPLSLPSQPASPVQPPNPLSLSSEPCASAVSDTSLSLNPRSCSPCSLANPLSLPPHSPSLTGSPDTLPLSCQSASPHPSASEAGEGSLALIPSVCSSAHFSGGEGSGAGPDAEEAVSVDDMVSCEQSEDAEIMEVAAAAADLVSQSEEMDLTDEGLKLPGEQMLEDLDAVSTTKEQQEEGDNSSNLRPDKVNIYDFLGDEDQEQERAPFGSESIQSAHKMVSVGNDDVSSSAPGDSSGRLNPDGVKMTGVSQDLRLGGCSSVENTSVPIKRAKIHRQDEGEVLLVKVGTAFKEFLKTHPAICGIYLNRGKRDVKRHLVTLQRQQGAVDTGSWQRGGRVHDRNRFDDYFVATEAGAKKQSQIQRRLARDEYAVNWYLFCPGRGNCRRKCGGYGTCRPGCPGMAHKQDRHNCAFMINLKLFLSDLTHWRVHITGDHIPTEFQVNWVPPRCENERIGEDTRDVIMSTIEGVRSTPTHIQEVLKGTPVSRTVVSKRRICRFVSSMKKRRRERKYDLRRDEAAQVDTSSPGGRAAETDSGGGEDSGDNSSLLTSDGGGTAVVGQDVFEHGGLHFPVPGAPGLPVGLGMVTADMDAERVVPVPLYHLVDPSGRVSLCTISPAAPPAPSAPSPHAAVTLPPGLEGESGQGGVQLLFSQPVEVLELAAMADSRPSTANELGAVFLASQPP